MNGSSPSQACVPHSFIEISRSALRNNCGVLRGFCPAATALAVAVKSNAYGHGVREVVSCIDDLVDRYLVDDGLEFVALRPLTEKSIALLGYVIPDQLAAISAGNGIFSVYDREHFIACETWARINRVTLNVQVAVDAHFGREGVPLPLAPELIAAVRASESMVLCGIYAHFTNAADFPDIQVNARQIEALAKALEGVDLRDIDVHIASSGGLFSRTIGPAGVTMVRPGLALYGMWPSPHLREWYEEQAAPPQRLHPVLQWKSIVAQVKQLSVGDSIGYSRTHVCERPTKVALIPQGYGHGLPRSFSPQGTVLIRETYCPVLGRISMNMMVVDVSHLSEVHSGDSVVLVGTQGLSQITADMHAEATNTIHYEVTTRISPLLPRIITE